MSVKNQEQVEKRNPSGLASRDETHTLFNTPELITTWSVDRKSSELHKRCWSARGSFFKLEKSRELLSFNVLVLVCMP